MTFATSGLNSLYKHEQIAQRASVKISTITQKSVMIQGKICASIFSSSYIELGQRSPDLPLVSRLLQLVQGNPDAFPGQPSWEM